ncbi:MAG TPA: hypothetical protein VG477_06695, partial [Thermoanaerobaculia bacterium]|nr:hypothetical protein [Thermoanaerobaculia bacterium]
MSVRGVWALGAVFVFFGAMSAQGLEPELVTANAGRFNVFDGKNARWETSWEVSFAPRRFHWFPRFVPDLSPTAGGLATEEG